MYFCGSFIGSMELELGRNLVLVRGIIRGGVSCGGKERYWLEMSWKLELVIVLCDGNLVI
jgi:hypothetical protein